MVKFCGVLVLGIGVALGGCRGGSQVVDGAAPGGELRAATTGLEGSAAYPAASDGIARRFLLRGGKDDGKWVRVERRGEAGTLIESWTVEGEKGPRFERVLDRGADGSVVMREQRSFDRNVRSVFEPPLMVFPARLEPDASFTMSSKMRVHPLDKPKVIKEQGMARVEITVRGVQALAAGADESVVVRTVFTADLKSADVVRTTDRWFVPAQGMVREVYEETVKVFGVVVERTGETFELQGEAQRGP